MKPNRKPILEEIASLNKQIKDLRKDFKDLRDYVEWGGSYIKKLLKIIGLE